MLLWAPSNDRNAPMDRVNSPSFGLSHRALRTGEQPIGFLITTALSNPHIISLAAGLVDYDTLPVPETLELMKGLLTEDAIGRSRLNYGSTAGLTSLRVALVEHLARLDNQTLDQFNAGPDQIIVTNGSQQLLSLLTEALVDPGDIVITAWPSYFVYTGVLVTGGAEVRCVDMDEQGMIPARLEALLQQIADAGHLPRVKIVYVVSYHDNPTGMTLAEERRPEILRIVKRFSRHHRILLMEDAAYRELTFEGQPPSSIRKNESHLPASKQQVALLQTFSKPFAPGFKVGYGLLPVDLMEKISLLKDNHDFGTANLSQHLLARALATGAYEKHVALLRQRYALKARRMLAALDRHLGSFFPGKTHWTHPRGGLYVWLTLPDHIDTGRSGPLFEQAVREGVLYVPGSYCYAADVARIAPQNTIRLSFGTATLEHIDQGIERLARAIQKVSSR
jgi:2-aminoadipate transaminase